MITPPSTTFDNIPGKAVESLKSICATFKFKIVGEPVLVKNAPDAEAQAALMNLGRLLAEAAGYRARHRRNYAGGPI